VSASVNTVMRTTGGSIGATIGASALTWSLPASGYPGERAYTLTMLLYATSLAGATLCAARIPLRAADNAVSRPASPAAR
jgi:hypothetical protein